MLIIKLLEARQINVVKILVALLGSNLTFSQSHAKIFFLNLIKLLHNSFHFGSFFPQLLL